MPLSSVDPCPDNPDDPIPTLPESAWGDFETALRMRDMDEPNGPSEWALVVYAGNNLGRVFPLLPGENLIGRSPMARIPLLDEEVSRHHALVRMTSTAKATRLVLEDLESTNGTFLNGASITTHSPLHAGDRISLGSHVLKVVAMDALERDFHRTLLEQSTRDTLTGLGNRETVLSEFQNRFELSRRHGRPMAAIMVDLDHFKHINDQYGHGAGDLALKLFGDLVRQTLRSTDLAGRIGGEEFLLVLPETDMDGALLLGERLRVALMESTVPLDSGPLMVTASFGIAQRS
jgi:two-component system cell cycle response regulator